MTFLYILVIVVVLVVIAGMYLERTLPAPAGSDPNGVQRMPSRNTTHYTATPNEQNDLTDPGSGKLMPIPAQQPRRFKGTFNVQAVGDAYDLEDYQAEVIGSITFVAWSLHSLADAFASDARPQPQRQEETPAPAA